MKQWEIWMEGYRATGEDVKATLCGVFTGETFDDAVEEFLNRSPQLRSLHETKERYLPRAYNGIMQKVKAHQIWMCGLYDNKVDAQNANG